MIISIVIIIVIIFAIIFYQFFLPKKEETKKMLTAYNHLEEAWELGLEWNSEAYLISINSVELKGSAEVSMGMESWYPDMSSDKTYGDGKTPVWLYGFGVDIHPNTTDADLSHTFAFYYNGEVKSNDGYYIGDEIPPMDPSIDSDEAAENARSDEGFMDALVNSDDLRISYRYFPELDKWLIEYESPDLQYDGEVWID